MTLEQLRSEVLGWHVPTFGGGLLWGPIAAKFREEAAELSEALEWGAPSSEVFEEIVDVQIVLMALVGRMWRSGIDWDFEEAILAKLEKLRHPDRNQIERDRERGILPEGWETK